MVLKSGERVGASEIGLLATMGVMMVKVFIYLFLCLKMLSNTNQG
jgi:molybdopterin biosynthesis enzyme